MTSATRNIAPFVPLSLAVLLGTGAIAMQSLWAAAFLDPLVIALLLGISVGTLIGRRWDMKARIAPVISWVIPAGIGFYAVKNLNFAMIPELPLGSVSLCLLVMLAYFLSIFLMGRLFGQKIRITFLVAVGSAICGASAIAMTAPAIESDSEEISISLLAVTLAGLLGLFVVLPFLATFLRMSGYAFGLMAGSTLQFTGFVKEAASLTFLSGNLGSRGLAEFALSVKAARYLGLLVAIPLLGSMVRKRFHLPWFLWIFLGAGGAGALLYMAAPDFYRDTLVPLVTPAYPFLWSIGMAAIGLGVDVNQLLSEHGIKALIMALGGFAAALLTFFLGLQMIY